MTMRVVDPELPDILDDHKKTIFSELNCHQIGKIKSYDKTKQTAEIEIQLKYQFEDGKTESYPLLVDCPVMTLQGGGAFFEMPIDEGDYCIVLFNDRDIDNWWSAETVKEPNTTRKHSLADGIAIVGINPKSSTLEIDGQIVKIITNDNPFRLDAGSKKIEIITTGDVEIKDAANIKMLGATEKMVKGSMTKDQFDTLMIAIKTHTHSYAGMPSGTGETAVPTNAGSMNNPIQLSDKISGE